MAMMRKLLWLFLITLATGLAYSSGAEAPALSRTMVRDSISWDARLGRTRANLLKWEQIREMQDYGISFQSHTLSHPDLTEIPATQAEIELLHSKTKLEEALGAPVHFIAYPYGKRNPEIDNLCRQAGYKAALSTIPGKNEAIEDRFCLKRLRVNGYTTMDEFTQLVENGFRPSTTIKNYHDYTGI